MTLKLSRVENLREPALAAIDGHFSRRIDQVMGPFGLLHALKRVTAKTNPKSPLVARDAEAIRDRANDQDEKLALLDTARLEAKAAIRQAQSAQEIAFILDSYGVAR